MSLQKGKVNNRLKRVKIELFPLKSSKAAKRLSLLWKKKNETLMSLEWKRIFFVVVVKKKQDITSRCVHEKGDVKSVLALKNYSYTFCYSILFGFFLEQKKNVYISYILKASR
jgi:hypothetical protein